MFTDEVTVIMSDCVLVFICVHSGGVCVHSGGESCVSVFTVEMRVVSSDCVPVFTVEVRVVSSDCVPVFTVEVKVVSSVSLCSQWR